mmetsp:Transcript_8718/g.18279  ORF Transcript_8718/g.18279 Transcript_8718/m.18279 type:complete len:319 (+) Transcript_8718:98-1054(+)
MPHVEIPQAEFKVVILGDTHIGKTSLVTRFAEGYYREHSRPATVGAFFVTKRIQTSDGTTCKIQIWDTAGQKSFRAMAHMFYRNAAAAIVCYDVGSKQSFEVMREWLDEIRRKTSDGDIIIAIAALKTDLLIGVNAPASVVLEQEVEQLAATLGAIYVPTSAKIDQNVNELFQRVADKVLEHRKSIRLTRNNNISIDDGYQRAPKEEEDLASPRRRDKYDKYYVPMQKNIENNAQQDDFQTMDVLNGGNRLPDTPHNGVKKRNGGKSQQDIQKEDELADGDNVQPSGRQRPSDHEGIMCSDTTFSCGVVESSPNCAVQ